MNRLARGKRPALRFVRLKRAVKAIITARMPPAESAFGAVAPFPRTHDRIAQRAAPACAAGFTRTIMPRAPHLEFNSEPRRRVYKLDQSIAEKFVKRLDLGDKLQSIEVTLQASDERMQQRREERMGDRVERATSINDNLSFSRPMDKAALQVLSGVAKTGEEILTRGKTVARAIGSAFNIGVELSGLFFSAFDTPKSPRQQARDNLQGERLTDRRNAEAEVKIDFSRYTGERAQQQRNDQQEQAARDRQRENERER
jgi:hypothetical protein